MPRLPSFHLTPLRPFKEGPLRTILEHAKARLEQIRDRNRGRGSGDPPGLTNQKERMRVALEKGEPLVSLAKDAGAKRILLTIYIEYLDRREAETWLPPFDVAACRLLLGDNGTDWHAARRRQAAQLFFQHYRSPRLPGLQFLAARLREAYFQPGKGPWYLHHRILFRVDGVAAVFSHASPRATAEALIEDLEIPPNSAFAVALRRQILLQKLERLSLQDDPAEILEQIQNQRSKPADGGYSLGVAALQIMVRKTMDEGNPWRKAWSSWISQIGCDPRRSRASTSFAKWWSWATPEELRTAERGMTGLLLEYFIEFLQDSLHQEAGEQFKDRRDFLMEDLFHKNKIQDVRLVLAPPIYDRLPKTLRVRTNTALLTNAHNDTSIICLKCTDDIYIVEGTHSFALRLFRGTFPVSGFWSNPQESYSDNLLRLSPSWFDGTTNLRLPHQGDWRGKFHHHLRGNYHIEW